LIISVAYRLRTFQHVQPDSFENERLQRGLIDSVTFMEVDGAN